MSGFQATLAGSKNFWESLNKTSVNLFINKSFLQDGFSTMK